MTEKRFTDNGIEEIENQSFTDNLTEKTYWIDNGLDDIVDLLNELSDENEQLKKEKEIWKSDACSLSSLNSILSNELNIAQEQGYEPSKPYKEYIASIKTEYDKFWENKIKTHNNRLR